MSDTNTVQDIGWALYAMRHGDKVRRAGWNGKGSSRFKVNQPPLLGIYPEGTEIDYHAHVYMKTAQGDVVPWLTSRSDLLATDWELAD
jgi:hypothetical protein